MLDSWALPLAEKHCASRQVAQTTRRGRAAADRTQSAVLCPALLLHWESTGKGEAASSHWGEFQPQSPITDHET